MSISNVKIVSDNAGYTNYAKTNHEITLTFNTSEAMTNGVVKFIFDNTEMLHGTKYDHIFDNIFGIIFAVLLIYCLKRCSVTRKVSAFFNFK